MGNEISPVSYTHLDVYKRQLRAQAYKFQEYARLLRNMAQMYEQREKELAELASALGAVKIRTAD